MSFRNSGPPQPVPPMKPIQLAQDISYVRPLTRRGIGPGLVVLAPALDNSFTGDIEDGIPSIRMKWAEEGYCVVEIRPDAWKNGDADPLVTAIDTFTARDECQPKEKLGIVCYDPLQWEHASVALKKHPSRFVGAVLYAAATSFSSLAALTELPTIFHLTSKSDSLLTRSADRVIHEYPSLSAQNFALPFHKDFHYASECVSHSRNLAFLKPRMGGPFFDLETLWDEHTYYEFEARSVENTMATMVQEPYVNHVPTLTGGIGRERLTAFYRDHFIFANPADAQLDLISRTVGVDRVVDEFIFKATFDTPIDWLLPGVPPTHTALEIPMMAVVNLRGDRLYHEHIHWDSASALRQIGALPATLPMEIFAAPSAAGAVPPPPTTTTNGTLANGHAPNGHHASTVNGNSSSSSSGGKKAVEIRVPVAEGVDAARKMRDKNAVESNLMFAFHARDL